MSRTHKHQQRRLTALVPIGLLAVVASFGLGMETAGDLHTIEWSSATDGVRGDMNADGTVDERDVIVILEVSQGYRPATPDELSADPNGNGVIAVDDAIRVLRSMQSR